MNFYRNKKNEIKIFLLFALIITFFLVVKLYPVIFMFLYLYLMRWSTGIKITIDKEDIIINYLHKKSVISIDTIEYIGISKVGIIAHEICFIPIDSFENQKYLKFGVSVNEYYNLYDNVWSIRLNQGFSNDNGDTILEVLNKEFNIPVVNVDKKK